MKNQYFYLPEHHRIVYCHNITEEDRLILGGLSEYLSDSKSNILRQSVDREHFKALKPIEINFQELDSYHFLEKRELIFSKTYCVHRFITKNTSTHLLIAKVLDSEFYL